LSLKHTVQYNTISIAPWGRYQDRYRGA